MVGAIILYVVAIITGGFGIVALSTSTSEIEAMRAATLCTIAGITLTGALIIDGIRFYAGKLSTQLEWLLRHASSASSSGASWLAQGASGGGAGGGGSRRRYRLSGQSESSGKATEMIVEAEDRTAALRQGEQAGLEVRNVEEMK